MAGIGRFQHTGAAPQTNLTSSMLATDTTFTTASGNGYPDGSVGDFVVAIDPGEPTEEHILCSSRAGAVFTVAGGVGGRGYDNTSASGHTAPTALVEHIVAATEIDDASRHINPTAGTPSDDHLNYPLLTGTRAFTGGVTISAGGLLVSSGGLAVSAGGAAITGNETVTGTLVATSTIQGTVLIPTGLSGSTNATRYVGATTSGAPLSGTYLKGDFVVDWTGAMWVCTTAGSPGVWMEVGGPTDQGWTNVSSFLNGWSAGATTPGWTRNGNMTSLRGSLATGSGGFSAFSLPLAYRPSQNMTFPVGGTATVLVGTAGGVVPSATTATLDGISFPLQ